MQVVLLSPSAFRSPALKCGVNSCLSTQRRKRSLASILVSCPQHGRLAQFHPPTHMKRKGKSV